MMNLDELTGDYLLECEEHLAVAERELTALGKDETPDLERIGSAFRAVHSIKGGATIFNFSKIAELAHRMEDVLALVRSGQVAPTAEKIHVLLEANDKLRDMVAAPIASNALDISEMADRLSRLQSGSGAPEKKNAKGRRLRMLLVEDDFASRLLLQTFLSRYGQCDIAVNGKEAVETVRISLGHGARYDLICMDIMMPEMDGAEAVRRIREIEQSRGILSSAGSKIIMTTTVNDIKEVSRCFNSLCDAYLCKPIDLAQLLGQMKAYRLVA